MSRSDAAARLDKLYKFIWQARYDYYVLDAPTVSDAVYDSLFREAENIEKEYPDLKAEIVSRYGWDDAPTDVVGSSCKGVPAW